jgi:hypothetical protein
MSKIVLISCVSKKLPHRAKAKDLYISDLFVKSLAYAHTLHPDRVFVLSAKYGLVNIEEELDPYEQTLNSMPTAEIRQWAETVAEQMRLNGIDFDNDEAVFLAGEKYRRYLLPYFRKASVPMEGLRIGEQLRWLNEKLAEYNEL